MRHLAALLLVFRSAVTLFARRPAGRGDSTHRLDMAFQLDGPGLAIDLLARGVPEPQAPDPPFWLGGWPSVEAFLAALRRGEGYRPDDTACPEGQGPPYQYPRRYQVRLSSAT